MSECFLTTVLRITLEKWSDFGYFESAFSNMHLVRWIYHVSASELFCIEIVHLSVYLVRFFTQVDWSRDIRFASLAAVFWNKKCQLFHCFRFKLFSCFLKNSEVNQFRQKLYSLVLKLCDPGKDKAKPRNVLYYLKEHKIPKPKTEMSKVTIHFFPKPSTKNFCDIPLTHVEPYGQRQLWPFLA